MVADQAAVAHEPAEGPFDGPAAGEHMEAFGLGGALDGFGLQFRAKFPDGAGELRTGVAAVDPELPEPGEPAGQRWSSASRIRRSGVRFRPSRFAAGSISSISSHCASVRPVSYPAISIA